MSTIASPRDPTTPLRRPSHNPPQGQPQPGTPTSSTRPSLDVVAPRSATSSPNPNSGALPTAAAGSASKRTNRAALREYYNLKKLQQQQGGSGSANASGASTPLLEVTEDPLGPQLFYSEIAPSELDGADFDADAYVGRTLAESGLEDLLRIYARVLGEIRALDAEKKALVYDNYSKLISATESIRKVSRCFFPRVIASTMTMA
jgi:hypothetical protein